MFGNVPIDPSKIKAEPTPEQIAAKKQKEAEEKRKEKEEKFNDLHEYTVLYQ